MNAGAALFNASQDLTGVAVWLPLTLGLYIVVILVFILLTQLALRLQAGAQ